MNKVLIFSEVSFSQEVLNKLKWFTLKNEKLSKSYVYYDLINKSYFKNGQHFDKEDSSNEILNHITELSIGEVSQLKIIILSHFKNDANDILKLLENSIIKDKMLQPEIVIIDYYPENELFNGKKFDDLELNEIRENKIKKLDIGVSCTYLYLTEKIYNANNRQFKSIKLDENIEKIASLIISFLYGNENLKIEKDSFATFGISQFINDKDKIIEAMQLYYQKNIFAEFRNEFNVKSVSSDAVQSEIDIFFTSNKEAGDTNKDLKDKFLSSNELNKLEEGFNSCIQNKYNFSNYVNPKLVPLKDGAQSSKLYVSVSNLFNPFSEYAALEYNEPNINLINSQFTTTWSKYSDETIKEMFKQIGQQIEDEKKVQLQKNFKSKIINIIQDGVEGSDNTNTFAWASGFVSTVLNEIDRTDVLRGEAMYYENHFTIDKAEDKHIKFFEKYLNRNTYFITENILKDIQKLKIKLDEVENQIHFINKIDIGDKDEIVIDGLLPDDKVFYDNLEELVIENEEILEAVDLRNKMTRIENQGQIGSCVSNAVVGLFEYQLNKNQPKESRAIDLSRLFVYYNSRALESNPPIKDVGSTISLAIESLRKYGVCEEMNWPYSEESKNTEPSTQSYIKASDYKILQSFVVKKELDSIKKCLSSGFPIIFGAKISTTFGNNKFIQKIKKGEKEHLEHSRHSMLICGYKNIKDKLWFIVRNSWGEDWCEKGYCYMSEDYILDENLTWDFLTFKIKQN